MSFEFTENVTLYMPNIDDQVKRLTESATATSSGESKKLIVELAAIHEGLTANYNMYSADQLEKSLNSWVQPYPKPIILNHDPSVDAVGRVMAARMDKESDGTPYIRLQVAVTDPAAIQKVMDERYLTGSVGGRTESATCSICNKEWANSSMFNLPCKHERGKVYNGKLAYLQLSDIGWKEYSFVNMPADQKSGLRSVTTNGGAGEGEEGDEQGWVRSVKFYTVDMNKESIMELSESTEPRNVLSEMTKKSAHATYLNVKGTFLSVSAFDYQEENEKSNFIQSDTTINNEQDDIVVSADTKDETISEENNMSQISTDEVEESILDVVTTLSADLASSEENDNSEAEEVAEGDAEESAETDTAEASDITSESDETVEEAAEAEEQLADDESIESPEEQVDQTADATTVEDEENKEEQAQEDNSELDALRTQIDSLREENVKLKKALHYTLAERVVDAKISAGLMESADRAEALEDHASRTPSSLADALRDLEKITRKVSIGKEALANLQTKAFASGNAGNSEFKDQDLTTESATETVSPEASFEDLLVDALMNRKKL